MVGGARGVREAISTLRNSESLPLSRQDSSTWAIPVHLGGAAALMLALTAAAPGAASEAPDAVEVETPIYRVVEPVSQPPERWVYTFSWSRFLTVAEVEIVAGELPGAVPEGVDGGVDREIRVAVRASTSRVLDLMWRYRMNADGIVRLDPFHPGRFEVRESIKRRPKTTRVEFDGTGGVHTYRNKKGIIREYCFDAPNSFDMASTIYLVLNQDLAVGRSYDVDTLAGNSRYLVTVEVVGKETVKAAGAEHPAFKLKVMSRDLTDPPDTEKHSQTDLWVSEQRPRRLLQADSQLWVGTVRGRLERIEAVSNWPAAPEEIDLGVDPRWSADTESREEPAVPEIRQGPKDHRAGPFRPR